MGSAVLPVGLQFNAGGKPMNTPKTRPGFVTAAVAVFSLTVAPAFAQTPAPTPTPPPAAQPSPAAGTDSGPAPADVLTKLHHSNQMEIEAGKLAQEKGQSKAIKDFGKMLVRDHSATEKRINSVAKQLKVELPAAAPPMKHEKLEKARALTGAEFDKAFTEAMVEDHKTDVEEITLARDKTTVPQLKKLLTEIVPKLEKHRTQAEKLNAAAETGTTTGREAKPAK